MTLSTIDAPTGGVNASATGDGHSRGATGTARPATPTVIARTTSGAYELQLLRPACGVTTCPHPAVMVLGARGMRQDVKEDERRSGQFCAVHAFERLDALDPAMRRAS